MAERPTRSGGSGRTTSAAKRGTGKTGHARKKTATKKTTARTPAARSSAMKKPATRKTTARTTARKPGTKKTAARRPAAPAKKRGVQEQLLGAVKGLVDRAGGIESLAKQFAKSGMADKVTSWIGTGKNRAVDAAQVTKAVGGAKIEQVAKKAGVSAKAASDGIASMLPKVVDALTPEGKIPKDLDLKKALARLKDLVN